MIKTLSAVLLAVAVMHALAGETRPVVKTGYGDVQGVIENGVEVYRGIPYAAPPVGSLRWRAPQPPAAWSGTRDAGDYGPVCPQMRPTRYPEDEDCLTLNVWTPGKSGEPKPVMVWIHGGAHVNGSGRTNGASFPKDGVVLVSINYRLGRFGVFAHPELTRALPPGEPTGNFGLLDQIAALKWVQREIGAFGGDPGRVTVFGVSAGGSYVNLLMVSPLASGLFQRAISESGANGLSRSRDLESQEHLGEQFAKRKDVEGIEKLRDLPWQQIRDRDAAYRTESNMIVDGIAVVENVPAAFRRGHQNNVPYLAGTNSFEGSLAAAIAIPAFRRIMNQNIDEITKAYDMRADDPLLFTSFYGDSLFRAPARYLVKQMRNVSSPAWLYYFDYVLESLDAHVPGARHGGEVAYVFDRLAPLSVNARNAKRYGVPEGRYDVSARDEQAATMMHQYWVQFARTGSPDRVGQPVWPAYDESSDPWFVFSNDQTEVRYGVRKRQLDLIEEGYRNAGQ